MWTTFPVVEYRAPELEQRDYRPEPHGIRGRFHNMSTAQTYFFGRFGSEWGLDWAWLAPPTAFNAFAFPSVLVLLRMLLSLLCVYVSPTPYLRTHPYFVRKVESCISLGGKGSEETKHENRRHSSLFRFDLCLNIFIDWLFCSSNARQSLLESYRISPILSRV